MTNIHLGPLETRVLGCLVEKEITTPEYYPLTLNALLNACNQKSNRDPLMSCSEDEVADAIDRLRDLRLITVLTGGSNRVPKYGHRLQEALNLGRRELALLCELMLRGPQTIGELRDRAGRMHRFSDIEETEACVRSLMQFAGGPLAMELPIQAGRKEPRFAQLLSGPPAALDDTPAPARAVQSSNLENRVAALEAKVAALEAELLRFRQQFE